MPRILCIVSREQPLLYGYLTTVFASQADCGDEVELILDRRHEQSPRDAGPENLLADRRRHPEIDEAIRSQGVALVRVGAITRRPARRPRSRLRAGAFALVALGAAGILTLAFAQSGRLQSVIASLGVRISYILDHFTQTKQTVRSPEDMPRVPFPRVRRGEESESPAAGTSEPTEQAPGRSGADPARSRAPQATRQDPSPTVAAPPRPAPVTAVVGGVNLAVYRGLPRTGPSSRPPAVSYTVHLSDRAGKPLIGAQVSLEGSTPEGRALHEPLSPARRLGTYTGSVRVEGLEPPELRVRVTLGSTRFEVPLPQ